MGEGIPTSHLAGCHRCYSRHPVGAESRSVLKKWVVGPVVEEASCQAFGQLSPSERVCWEDVFSQRKSSTSYRALRIPNPPCFRDPEREVKQPMDCACEC
jgi:hypothetical protein